MSILNRTPALDPGYKLPLRKHGNQWQFRKQINGKRVEIGLGTSNRAVAEMRARKIVADMDGLSAPKEWALMVSDGMKPKGWLRVMAANIRSRMREKGGEIDLGALEAIALRSEGRCEVSGIAFSMKTGRNPWQPSIDRIDSSKGYTIDNVRFVCLAANYCMSHWGEAVFMKIAAAMLYRKMEALAEESLSQFVPNDLDIAVHSGAVLAIPSEGDTGN